MKNETDTLNEEIIVMENKRNVQLQLLTKQFHISYESLKPINLLMSTFRDVTSSPELKNNVINTALGIGTGTLSKKLLVGGSHNPFKRMIGTFIQYTIANVVSKHGAGIKFKAVNLLSGLLNRRIQTKQTSNKINESSI